MAKIIQTRRGSVEQHIGFDGQQGEVTFDLTANTLRVHDGSTFPADQPSGYPLARADLSNVFNAVGIQQLNLPEGTPGQFLTTDGAGTISFTTIDTDNTDFDLGGDLSGTISAAQINANTISGNELDIAIPPTDGHFLTIDSTGALGFIMPQTEFTLAGDVNGPIGNNFLATNTVDTNNLIDLNVTTDKLAADAVTNAKLADDAVLNTNIVDGTITGAKIGAGQINSSHIAADIIIAEDIAANAITIAELQDGAVIENKIANNAVTSNKIANNAVGITQLSVQSDGNAGEFLQTNGAGILSFATAASTLTGGTGLVGIQTFGSVVGTNGEGNGISSPNITTHTWTKPAGVTKVLYFVTGGGGGDGIFSTNGDGTQNNPAQASVRNFGGGGGTVMGFLDVTNIVSETVTVGSCGGNALANALNSPGNPTGLSAGQAGEASTFGSHATAFGGGGGNTGVNGSSAVNPNDTTAAAAGNPGGGGGIGGDVQMRGSASASSRAAGTSFWGQTPGGGNGNINRANQGGSGIVVILEFG